MRIGQRRPEGRRKARKGRRSRKAGQDREDFVCE
jgi:hypothetical protein